MHTERTRNAGLHSERLEDRTLLTPIIGGRKFLDVNGDGVRNEGDPQQEIPPEPWLNDVPIHLVTLDPVSGEPILVAQTLTHPIDLNDDQEITPNEAGFYRLPVPEPGIYFVIEPPIPGLQQTAPDPSQPPQQIPVGPELFQPDEPGDPPLPPIPGPTFGNVEVGPRIPPAPTSVDLLASSDTGNSDSDDLTNRNNRSENRTLQFAVGGMIPGALVAVFADGNFIGGEIAQGNTTIVTTNGFIPLPDGPRVITARQIGPDGDQASEASPELPIQVDSVPPLANIVDVTPDPRNTPVSSIDIGFTEPVGGFDRGDLVLAVGQSDNLLGPAHDLSSPDNQHFTLNSDLAGVTNVGGRYHLTLVGAGSGIADAAGNQLVGDAVDSWLFGPGIPVFTGPNGGSPDADLDRSRGCNRLSDRHFGSSRSRRPGTRRPGNIVYSRQRPASRPSDCICTGSGKRDRG